MHVSLGVLAVASLALATQAPLLAQNNDFLRSEGYRLISTSPNTAEWMTEVDIFHLHAANLRFVDRTDSELDSLASLPPPKKYAPPKKPSQEAVVEPLLEQINIEFMTEWLTFFSSFKTRYYRSPSGKEAVEWLHNSAVALAEQASPSVNINIQKFEHDWSQFSVIVRVEAASQQPLEEELPVVILSAHSDSINSLNPWWGRAPGAEDDGSGCVTIFETYRILVESGFVPKRPIEFHWYSGEEAGLLGSQKVAASYKKQGKAVAGVYHADETGFTPKGKEPVIGISTDYVDSDLEDFLRKLIKEYVPGAKVVDTECGYACSDHASWTEAGYASTYLFDTRMEDGPSFVHGSGDEVSRISFEHMSKFVKVAIAFAVEMSLDS
ncbi:hypothetical protein HDU98_010592 [Podochytrium sp. JEL0797]|nr:hypothetical protein HDU98_010592 [Podochytrium sp. JEL0797]